jgi:hypothetical protein
MLCAKSNIKINHTNAIKRRPLHNRVIGYVTQNLELIRLDNGSCNVQYCNMFRTVVLI